MLGEEIIVRHIYSFCVLYTFNVNLHLFIPVNFVLGGLSVITLFICENSMQEKTSEEDHGNMEYEEASIFESKNNYVEVNSTLQYFGLSHVEKHAMPSSLINLR